MYYNTASSSLTQLVKETDSNTVLFLFLHLVHYLQNLVTFTIHRIFIDQYLPRSFSSFLTVFLQSTTITASEQIIIIKFQYGTYEANRA